MYIASYYNSLGEMWDVYSNILSIISGHLCIWYQEFALIPCDVSLQRVVIFYNTYVST